jgi:hypothetical protein
MKFPRTGSTLAIALSALIFAFGAASTARADTDAVSGKPFPLIIADAGYDTSEARQALAAIGGALSTGEARTMLRFFHSKVFLTLLSGENGYYSAEQSYFILRNFFAAHNSAGFSWTGTNLSDQSAWGVGTLRYLKRGQRGNAQVFVSLTRGDQGWRINQLTIAKR